MVSELHFFFFFKFIDFLKLKDNCFTELCWFLPNVNINQPQVYLEAYITICKIDSQWELLYASEHIYMSFFEIVILTWRLTTDFSISNTQVTR